MEDIKIINEDDKSYTALKDGKEVKFYKIDPEAIKLKHSAELYEASKYISKRNLDQALFFIRATLKNPPNIVDYEGFSQAVVGILRRFEFDLKPHNLTHLVHSFIKQIDIECYGKAQTFMKEIETWHEDLKVIESFKEEMERD